MTKWLLALSALAFGPVAHATDSATNDVLTMAPVFVGASPVNASVEPEMAFAYMTAPEMQAKVQNLTGYRHPAFVAYADVLGRYDPRSGLRTNDRPSLITVFFMQKIADAVATAVLQREIFLDDSERIVYPGVDLASAPTDASLEATIAGLYTRWLGVAPEAASIAELAGGFRRVQTAGNPTLAYQWLTGMMIRHGGLYYY